MLEIVIILCGCCGEESEVSVFKDRKLECVHCGSTDVEIIERVSNVKKNSKNDKIIDTKIKKKNSKK